jgi:hypothetical protein
MLFLMEKDIKVNFFKIKSPEKEYIIMQMVIYMMEIGIKIKNMVMEKLQRSLVALFMKDNFKMVKNMVKAK